MTSVQFLDFIATIGYSALLLGGVLLLLWNMFILYDDGMTMLYFNEQPDMGWLALLLIPVEAVVMSVYIIVVAPYILL